MTWNSRPVLMAAAILGIFSVLGIGLVALVHENTKLRISENQRQTLLHTLQTLIPKDRYDNDLLEDAIEASDPDLNPYRPTPIYRARSQGRPVAVVIAPSATDGYSGEIRLLIAIWADHTLAGVRVLSHKETPGLGDPIDENKSNWILRFTGLSLDNPPESQWKVKRDGGAFDQFTGATVTPRAVVKAVRKTLSYFDAHKHWLFEQAAQKEVDSPVQDE